MTRRVQPRLFGTPAVTYPGRRGVQLTLPGLDPLAERQLDADALREWMERMRAAELPELDDVPDLET